MKSYILVVPIDSEGKLGRVYQLKFSEIRIIINILRYNPGKTLSVRVIQCSKETYKLIFGQ